MKNVFEVYLSLLIMIVSLATFLQIFEFQFTIINAQNEYYRKVDEAHIKGEEIYPINEDVDFKFFITGIEEKVRIQKENENN